MLTHRLLRKRIVRYCLLTLNVALLISIAGYFLFSHSPNQVVSSASLSSDNQPIGLSNPLDQVSAADIAETASTMVNLPEATAVRNNAETVQAELSIAPVENVVAAKPQVVATALKSREDIQVYVVQPGDTVSSVATKFNITANSVQWSNGILGNNLNAGTKLTIPPINGIVYTVKAGDTAQTLAQKYNVDASEITFFNDAEITGLTLGEQIVIPNGQQPAVTSYSTTGLYGGGVPSFGGDGYDFGYCTYWVAMRRIQVGEPVPNNLGNASSWGYLARAFGLSTGTTPQVHAAVIMSTVGQGHVAFVESVNADGSMVISEMNHDGWDKVDTRTIPASEADTYTYIY